MADVVDTLDVFKGQDILIRRITNISDGTGETSVVKVAKSAFTDPRFAGNAILLGVEELSWSIQGFSSVRMFWNHTTPDELAILGPGNGWRLFGGMLSPALPIWDPASAGLTGDIILSTAGALVGATYDILMKVRCKFS